MFGGISGINGFVFVLSMWFNLDFWKEFGNNGWGYDVIDWVIWKVVIIYYLMGVSEGFGFIYLVGNELEIEVRWLKI